MTDKAACPVPSGQADERRYGRDGRRVVDPPCEFGHKLQAMECPSCADRLGHGPSSQEHWDWYRKRTNRTTRDNTEGPS